ncbi:MAG TPA: FtsX-like permease family protein [Rhodospirillales bacterium]|nr:FtsX-like permease family protein [Rhodospirillales bacterium]
MTSLALAWTFARRELRAGFSGFLIFLACLALGVAAIAAVGWISASVVGGLNANARDLLGGDVSLRLNNRDFNTQQMDWLMANTVRQSSAVEMRAMAAPVAKTNGNRKRSLVELKGVDSAYPLYGDMVLDPPLVLADALTRQDNGTWGTVVDKNLLLRLGLDVGDKVRVGVATLTITATIVREPDRVATVLSLGPRLMVSARALGDTGLVQPGSQINFQTRAVIAKNTDMGVWQERLNAAFPNVGWRLLMPDQAAPGVRRFIQRLALFLGFVGLTALLVGGIGVSNAISSYLDGRTAAIATFKCLGAPATLVFQIYLLQVLVIGAVGIVLGLIAGAALPTVVLSLLADYLPVAPEQGFYIKPLLVAAIFGLLTALTFALWPLGRAGKIPAATLFRDKIAPSGLRPGKSVIVASALGVVLLAILTVATSSEKYFALWFVGGALLTLALLRLGAVALVAGAARMRRPKGASLRLAISNIYRPGSNASSIIVSLGLGLSVLIAVALIEGNLNYQIKERLPEKAPAFFFIDIQPDQVAEFDQTVTAFAETSGYKRMPSLRGRIVKIGGVRVEDAAIAQHAKWAVHGDRALTTSATMTDGSILVAGKWWPKDYAGPPLISLDRNLANGFGIGLGDTLTVNVLGRQITGTIASLRDINWRSLRFDFAIIFAPGPLEGAPYTHIAAIEAPASIEDELEEAVASRFTNITTIRVREALQAASLILTGIGQAVRGTSLITILAGALVLAGTIAAGQRRRIYTSVVFKVLGATRAALLKAFVLEFGILGLATGIVAAAIGTLTSWAVMVYMMQTDWIFLPGVVAWTVTICLMVTISAGFLGTWRALSEKASHHLRNE